VVKLVVLDVNETLFSLDPVADGLARIGLEGQFQLWFTRVLRDGFAAAAAGHDVTFAELARHHLAAMLEQQGASAEDELLDEAIGGFDAVTAHPDVEPGLRALRAAGVTTVTLTVGGAAITRGFLEREGLTDLVDRIYDAEAVGGWKPTAGAYRHVLTQHGVAAADAALVAVHPWDVMGAQRAGLVGAWLDRSGARWPPAYPAPTVTARTLPSLVEQLLAPRGAGKLRM
jgi:2-haloacid dehalogenase